MSEACPHGDSMILDSEVLSISDLYVHVYVLVKA